MYDFIKGTIVELNPAYVVLDNQGIGYMIHVSLNSYSQLSGDKNSDIKLFIHQIIREDSQALYGFTDEQERRFFRLLISVSGIGANSARMMLSSLSPQELEQTIVNGEVQKLKAIKGIGIKTAQRVIIELKDKVSKNVHSEEIFTGQNNTLREEALSALIMLGFPKKEVEKTMDKLISEEKNLTVEELVKKALKKL
jgi:holliday junction DNA helicase RuvA